MPTFDRFKVVGKKHKVVHVAHVATYAQVFLDPLVKGIETHIDKELQMRIVSHCGIRARSSQAC